MLSAVSHRIRGEINHTEHDTVGTIGCVKATGGPLITDPFLYSFVSSPIHPFEKPAEFGTVLGTRYPHDSDMKRDPNRGVSESLRCSQTPLRGVTTCKSHRHGELAGRKMLSWFRLPRLQRRGDIQEVNLD